MPVLPTYPPPLPKNIPNINFRSIDRYPFSLPFCLKPSKNKTNLLEKGVKNKRQPDRMNALLSAYQPKLLLLYHLLPAVSLQKLLKLASQFKTSKCAQLRKILASAFRRAEVKVKGSLGPRRRYKPPSLPKSWSFFEPLKVSSIFRPNGAWDRNIVVCQAS